MYRTPTCAKNSTHSKTAARSNEWFAMATLDSCREINAVAIRPHLNGVMGILLSLSFESTFTLEIVTNAAHIMPP